jgi:hypothetical protein
MRFVVLSLNNWLKLRGMRLLRDLVVRRDRGGGCDDGMRLHLALKPCLICPIARLPNLRQQKKHHPQ